MKDSLIIVGCFVLGVIVAICGLLPEGFVPGDYTEYLLYLLLICVGIAIGMDESFIPSLKGQRAHHLLMPLLTVLGTLAGCLLAFCVMLLIYREPPVSALDTVAAGAGYGYYSLSSIMLDKARGAQLGTIALAANLFRELITLLAAPLIRKCFGPYALISSGGATSMDTTMGVIVKQCGSAYAPVSLYHGIILSIAVPFIVTLIISLY